MSRFKILHPQGRDFFENGYVILEHKYPPHESIFDTVLDVEKNKLHILFRFDDEKEKADRRIGYWWAKIIKDEKEKIGDLISNLGEIKDKYIRELQNIDKENLDMISDITLKAVCLDRKDLLKISHA